MTATVTATVTVTMILTATSMNFRISIIKKSYLSVRKFDFFNFYFNI